jgi:hypothetical protein
VADIDVERKSSSNWIWWLIGLIILALIIWWLLSRDDTPDVDTAAVPAAVTPAPDTMAGMGAPATAVAAGIPVGEILANPAEWSGRTVSGSAQVGEVPTDRGFWVEGDGQRIFAILNDQPAERPENINPGQAIDLNGATVVTDKTQLPGDLDAQTKQIVDAQPAFLMVPETAVSVTAPGSATSAGTAPADSAP